MPQIIFLKPKKNLPISRVIVSGGRNFNDRDFIFKIITDLDQSIGPFSCIIHGAASGVDTEGMLWAQMMADSGRPITHAPFVADWNNTSHPDAIIKYNKASKPYDALAGFRRNQRMLDDARPDALISFPGGKGTKDMLERALKTDIQVIKIIK